MLPAQPVQLPRAADAAQRRIQPQGHENSRVRGRLSGAVLYRLDRVLQRRQVQAAYVFPDDPCFVVIGNQLVERAFPKLHLVADRMPQPLGTDSWRQCRGGRHRPLAHPPIEQIALVHHLLSGSRIRPRDHTLIKRSTQDKVSLHPDPKIHKL